MISVVSVYNDLNCVNICLRRTLERQIGSHECIFVDNSANRFSSASVALNYGAAQVQGDWVMFAHQDVHLLCDSWLASAEEFLESLGPGVGWVGVAGATPSSHFCGMLIDRARLLGKPFFAPTEVQTLDECVLIHRRNSSGKYFDESLVGWHAYGVEACCQAIRDNARNYVLPLLIHHDSPGVNLDGLSVAHDYVRRRHAGSIGTIVTNSGTINMHLHRKVTISGRVNRAIAKRLHSIAYLIRGYNVIYANSPEDAVDELLEEFDDIHVWHPKVPQDYIEVQGLIPHPRRSKRIIHDFREHVASSESAVYIPCDLVNLTADSDLVPTAWTLPGVVVVGTNSETARSRSRLFKALRKAASKHIVARRWDASSQEVLLVINNMKNVKTTQEI